MHKIVTVGGDCMNFLTDPFEDDYSPKAVIDLAQIYQNALAVRKKLGKSQFCAVVKSDAYGHGACKVALKIQPIVDAFAVATLFEARSLRLCGIEKPIICLLPVADVLSAVFYRIELTVCGPSDFERILAVAQKNGVSPKLHLAVNTGMNRLGYDRLDQFERDVYMAYKSGLSVAGVSSHFYNATDYRSDCVQYERFKPYSLAVKQYYPSSIAHACSSGGLEFGEFNADMARIGLLIYGYKPVNGTLSVLPAMRVFAKNIVKRSVRCGDFVLYGDKPSGYEGALSVLQYGYADGFANILGGVKKACMNLSAVSGEDDVFEIVPDFNSCNAGVYEGLIRLGSVRDKIYLG